jgi:predicted CXXCH cytochrome family protein
MRWHVALALGLSLVLACDKKAEPAQQVTARRSEPDVGPPATEVLAKPATFTGSGKCVGCHAAEAERWRGSHHDLAMQEPSATTVLGDFRSKTLRVRSEIFRFRQEGTTYWVDVTQGGKTSSFQLRYLFGVEPLQQLLVDVGKGHLQALSVAWDARPKAKGGQRWFFLHPDEVVAPGDPLHWQGAQFNWNRMCADCHSTGVSKGYAPETRSYATSFAEIDVACEACHGPGSAHVAAAEAKRPALHVDGFRALTMRDRRWVFAEGASIAHLEGERSLAEQETCAPCHSRRAELFPDGASYHDRHRLALLEDPLYFADGQVREEVFEYGSFLQSRMHAAGVTCSDCHDPHALSTRERGNALCAKCHKAEVFDTPAHHFHAAASEGAACVACHMPERTYMVIDARREHRFSVPRPDLSERVHSPDPCTSCHRDKPSGWAATQLEQRGHLRKSPHFASALALSRAHLPGAPAALLSVVKDPAVVPIARATALVELAAQPGPELLEAVRSVARGDDVLLRRAAAEALAELPASLREPSAGRLLADPARSVRTEAAHAFVGATPDGLEPATREELTAALRELTASAVYRADQGDGLLALAGMHVAAGDAEAALKLQSEAIARDPSYTAGYVNKADLLRALDREQEAQAVLQSGLTRAGDTAALQHALGLSQIRTRQMAQALASLAAAHKTRPEVVRYAFVYAIALFDTGDKPRALQVLRDALARAPADPQLLSTLADYAAQLGLEVEARSYAARLAELRKTP